MKPQKQLFRHRPADGVFGDCHRTAIAVILDLDAADVPHFMDGGVDGNCAADRAEAWLNERGIVSINVIFDGSLSVGNVLATVNAYNRRSRPAFIILGKSRNGVHHAVVCCDGEIVCDPSQDDSGIVGPCDDGFYWLTFFGHLDATADPARRGGRSVRGCRRDAKGCGGMSNLAGIVKQIAVSVEDETVSIELICADNYGAQVLKDDVASRLKVDRVLSLIVKVSAEPAA